jgi:stalled ribosome alternative rescue factor ArfA
MSTPKPAKRRNVPAAALATPLYRRRIVRPRKGKGTYTRQKHKTRPEELTLQYC